MFEQDCKEGTALIMHHSFKATVNDQELELLVTGYTVGGYLCTDVNRPGNHLMLVKLHDIPSGTVFTYE
jgi:hypothetical protein